MPWKFPVDFWGVGLGEHLAFGVHVDFHVDVSGVEIGMAQPVADHVEIVP